MKRLVPIAGCFFLLGLGATPAVTQTGSMKPSWVEAREASPAAFQDYWLGMPLDEFRAMQHKSARGDFIGTSCSDAPKPEPHLVVLPRYKRAGVVKCWVSEVVGSTRVRASMRLTADHMAVVGFSFFNDRLYEIEVFADIEALTPIRAGLGSKFGKPSNVGVDVLQNAYGAEFQQQMVSWTPAGARIGLIAPIFNVRRLGVFYTATGPEAEVEAKVRADPENSARM